MRQRLEFRAACILFGLPPSIQLWLSGRPPFVIDGCTLHPEMQLLLRLRDLWRGPPIYDLTPEEARANFRNDTAAIAGPPNAVGSVTDLSIETPTHAIGARHYMPTGSGPNPLLVFYHGGGFVSGDLDSHDTLCRQICRDAGIQVLSVDYRLAPEHRFPAAVDDACAAFRWAHANAERLGAVPDRIAVGGDSAGGNLAAVVAQMTVADGGPAPCAQMLFYPTLDRTRTWPSMEFFGDGRFLIARGDIEWSHLHYTGTTEPSADPAQNPLCCANLAGLPPALIVTAGFDPLRDEAEAYAGALRSAGVPVVMRRFEGLLHGFCSMATFSPACAAALASIMADVRALLAGDANERR